VNLELWRRFTGARKDLLSLRSENLQLLSQLGLSETEVHKRAHDRLNFDLNPALASSTYSDNVALLFHGTRGNVDEILGQGLDERLGGGGTMGRGIYFSGREMGSEEFDEFQVGEFFV
jgi:hypothetical protein